jgi:type I restriction enzyme S subunit
VSSAVVNHESVDEPTALVTEAALRETNLTLYPPGSLLIAMYGEGSTRGRVSELGIWATTNQALAVLKIDGASACVRAWTRLFLEHNYRALRRAASGGVQPNLNLGIIRAIVMPLPPLREQTRIIEAAQMNLSTAATLAQALEVSETRSARLRQSILKWAFEGKLVDQDRNDEPASVLLQRIRQARAEQAGQGRMKKATRKARRTQ